MYIYFTQQSEKHEDFASPIRSLWKVILQTSGDIDGGSIFKEPNSYYPVVGYALFIIFIIAMPILFNNFLVCAFNNNILTTHSHCNYNDRLVWRWEKLKRKEEKLV